METAGFLQGQDRRAGAAQPDKLLIYLAIAAGCLVLLIAVAVYVLGGPPSLRARANWGFGPEWDCTSVGRGEPVCIKKSP
jgi:hypothetical protein